MRGIFVAASLIVVGCSVAKAPQTGEALIDRVVSLENAGSRCVTFVPRNYVFTDDPYGPPGMLSPASFENQEARAAAKVIAIDWQDAPDLRPQTIGTFEGDRCLMFVSGPATSGDFSFLFFSDPGGERGAYAFKNSGEDWKLVEKVKLGYW